MVLTRGFTPPKASGDDEDGRPAPTGANPGDCLDQHDTKARPSCSDSASSSPAALHRLWGHAPASKLIAHVRAHPLRWAVPAAGLGLLCFLAAATFTGVISRGGPGWLNLAVILLVVDGMRLLAVGPASVANLVRAKLSEAITRGHAAQ
jgi:hypothetical protein